MLKTKVRNLERCVNTASKDTWTRAHKSLHVSIPLSYARVYILWMFKHVRAMSLCEHLVLSGFALSALACVFVLGVLSSRAFVARTCS